MGEDTASSLARSDDSFDALLRQIAAGESAGPPLPKSGDVIAGKYRVEDRLGQGGMGVVYRATHTISGKQVAIKWMLRASSSDQGRSRFLREARAAARIDHENVVDIYDIGQDGDHGLYLVMQLLRGESLASRIDRGSIPISEAIDVLLPAMRGVAAVHAAGVIHRDLKPDNIFLCEAPPGGKRSAKVLDFGISSVIEQDEAQNTLTREGAFLGTPTYMSPEQIEDSRSVDARSDVYAFGVILYECLTGRPPYRAQTPHALVNAIVSHEPRDPRDLRPELPTELARVVMRAMSKRRDARYRDVDSLIQALTPWSSHGERASTIAPSQQRAWTPWVVLLTVLVALAALYWLTRPPPPVARPRRPELVEPVVQAPAPPVVIEPAPPPEEVAPMVVDAGIEPVSKPLRAKQRMPPKSAPHAVPERAPASAPRSGTIQIEEL